MLVRACVCFCVGYLWTYSNAYIQQCILASKRKFTSAYLRYVLALAVELAIIEGERERKRNTLILKRRTRKKCNVVVSHSFCVVEGHSTKVIPMHMFSRALEFSF